MAESNALPLVLLAEQFAKLPGIGMKSAQRLAYYVMSMTDEDASALQRLSLMPTKRSSLQRCQNFTDKPKCPICADPRRDHTTVCVVEDPKDIAAFERTKEYKGVYHVLHGLLSPMDDISTDKLKIKELLARIEPENVKEVIMATNPTVNGEATAIYISRLLKPLGVKVTRLAFGLPVGGVLEYADRFCFYKALGNRTKYKENLPNYSERFFTSKIFEKFRQCICTPLLQYTACAKRSVIIG